MYETVLHRIKTLKWHCEASLKVSFNKKVFWWWQKNYLYDRFFMSNENSTT